MKSHSVIVVMLAVNACRAPVAEVEKPEPFLVASARRGGTYEREYVGEVQAVQHVGLRARLKGYIEAVAVDEGQTVKSGQLILTISARELQQEVRKAHAAVESAAAELKTATIERESTRMLAEKKVISGPEFELAESKVVALAARLEEAKAHEGQASINLSYGQVRAPFDGVLNRLPLKAGSLVSEDELLTTITNTSEVFVYFRVSEQEYLTFAASRPDDRPRTVSFKLANGALFPVEGVIDAVETEFDKATGNLAFRARFKNEQGLLRHGATGKAVISTALGDALIIPQQATFEVQENLYVFKVTDDDTVHATRVVPRLRLGQSFVLESGLSETDRFVVEGTQQLKEGARIVATAAPSTRSPQ